MFSRCAWRYLNWIVGDDGQRVSSAVWPMDVFLRAFFWIKSCYVRAPFVLALGYFAAAGSLGICLLLLFQLYGIARNRTTNEHSNWWRLEYLRTENISHGIKGNCLEFWTGIQQPNWYSLVPTTDDAQPIPPHHYNVKIAPLQTIVIDVAKPGNNISAPSPIERAPELRIANSPEPNFPSFS